MLELSGLAPADAVIVIPAFTSLDMPVYGPHVLQACARSAGFTVRILYANFALANALGEERYRAIDEHTYRSFVGERAFAAVAHPDDDLGVDAETRGVLDAWTRDVASAVADRYPIVGCSSTFQQLWSSVLILGRVKQLRPSTVTLAGGANCEGVLADGVASLTPHVDFILSGESETTFVALLDELGRGHRPPDRIVRGAPCSDLDAVPLPDYEDFFRQRRLFLPDAGDARVVVPLESSRGCWWGQKYHCTFCGDPMVRAAYRERSPARVAADLRQLAACYPCRRVQMIDDIMPFSYFRTLLPELAATPAGERPTVFYMQKANLTLGKVAALKEAGVDSIQPGIESLSTPVLRRMNKGITAAQCIALLRYARAVGLEVRWNLLTGFPGDRATEYEAMLALLPLLRHLQPPFSPEPVVLQRWSPYVSAPQRYGIRNLRPLPAFAELFPGHPDVSSLAYDFAGDFESESLEGSPAAEALVREVDAWTHAWEADTRPSLGVSELTPQAFALVDTRGLQGAPSSDILDAAQAAAVLGGSRKTITREVRWALDRRLLVELDGWYVPLATASPELLARFGRAVDAAQAEPAPEELISSLVRSPRAGA